jgi:hypothetical protein
MRGKVRQRTKEEVRRIALDLSNFVNFRASDNREHSEIIELIEARNYVQFRWDA